MSTRAIEHDGWDGREMPPPDEEDACGASQSGATIIHDLADEIAALADASKIDRIAPVVALLSDGARMRALAEAWLARRPTVEAGLMRLGCLVTRETAERVRSRIHAGAEAIERARRRAPPIGAIINDGPAPAVWDQLDLRRPSKTAPAVPCVSVPNACKILALDYRWRERIRFNLFSQTVEIDSKALTEEDETGVMLWLHDIYGVVWATPKVSEAVRFVARAHEYHPVRDWLDSLIWDGEPRAHRLLDYYLSAEGGPNELRDDLSECFLVSCVARVMDPGCKVDTVLILVGKQGRRKSTALHTLAGDGWFADTPIQIGAKDGYQTIQGRWIYELGELDSLRAREWSAMKVFFASQSDRYRPSFGRYPRDFPRQTVFVGSTNEPEFLGDPSGARRFWPVRVGHARVEELADARDQLWAEAVHLYRQGRRWHLEGQAVDDLRAAQAEFAVTDPWDDAIGRWLSSQIGRRITTADVLAGPCERRVGDQTRHDQMRVGGILARFGWQRERSQVDGVRAWGWVRG